MIKLTNVTKVIKNNTILSQIDLTLSEGKCYLLKGANGSGKTMLLRMICHLIRPTEGDVVHDKDYTYGVIIENPSFLKHETVFQNLKILSSVRNCITNQHILAMLERFNLSKQRKTAVRKLSLGMNQRLALCQAFMEDPDVLLLDEPFNALDDENVKILLEVMEEKKKENKIIVVAAHGLEDHIMPIFDRVVTMKNGEIQ